MSQMQIEEPIRFWKRKLKNRTLSFYQRATIEETIAALAYLRETPNARIPIEGTVS